VADFGIPMHVLPGNSRKTSERLAFVTGGADWRSIEGNWLSSPGWTFAQDVLVPTDAQGGVDPRLGRIAHNNVLRLGAWDSQAPCVTGGGGGANGNVADIRLPPSRDRHTGKFFVADFDGRARTVTGSRTGSGACDVSDPRPVEAMHGHAFGVQALDEPSGTITGRAHPSNGRFSVEDTRLTCTPNGATLRVVETDGQSPPVIGTSGVWSSGSMQVADARVNAPPRNGSFGVQELDDQADTVTGSIDVHNGPAAVAAAPHGRVLIAPDWKLWHRAGRWVPCAWHRPFSLKELARLQSFPDDGHDGRPLQLAGSLDEQRMQIGNAVPFAAARVIAELMLATLLASKLGVAVWGGGGIWVREAGVLRWHASSREQADMRGVE
jgi:hypothetical protein